MIPPRATPEPTIITSLELADPAGIVRSTRAAPAGLTITRVDPPDPQLNHRLYVAIGSELKWTDRLVWSAEQWAGHVAAAQTYRATLDGADAGFYELTFSGGSAEIAIFGLLPAARGLGVGAALLVDALERGLAQAARVWLHTCTDDDPSALPNYQARGLRIFDVSHA